jgi:hypothetical protein
MDLNEKHRRNSGVLSVVEKYRSIFNIPENTNYYSKEDYRKAERRFIKYALFIGYSGSQLK